MLRAVRLNETVTIFASFFPPFLANQLRAFTDSRDDLSLGHVVVLLQYDWPQGEMLFLKAVDKICQQGSFQYENFFNYVTSILFALISCLYFGVNRQFSLWFLYVLDVGFLKLMVFSDIDMLEEFAYLRTPEGGRIQLELLPNQGMLIK